MLFELLLLAFLNTAAVVVAQTSTTSRSASPASAPSTTSPWPTTEIFFPASFPSGLQHLGASVITADLSETAYAIDCMTSARNATYSCGLSKPITVTHGESTLIYTFEPALTENALPTSSSLSTSAICCNTVAAGATINCQLMGSSHSHASRAVCTGNSSISGLGFAGSTTTLASTKLQYATITMTAGLAHLDRGMESAAMATGGIVGTTGLTSSAGGARVTAGAVAGLGFGVVGFLGRLVV